MKLEQFKRQQIAKMNDRVPTEKLGTCRLNNIFHKLFLYDPNTIKKYVWVIGQALGQDGWILAKFFFCVFMDRDEVEVHKHAKKE